MVKPIYQHFLKYWLSVSVKVRTDKILATSNRLWPYIGLTNRLYFSDFTRYISKTPIYQQFIEYRLSVSVKFRTNKISVIRIGFGQISVIGYRLNLSDMPSLPIGLGSQMRADHLNSWPRHYLPGNQGFCQLSLLYINLKRKIAYSCPPLVHSLQKYKTSRLLGMFSIYIGYIG